VPSSLGPGDDISYEEFAALRAPRLFRRAYLRLGNREDAEDAAQVVLSILYRKWASATRDGTPDAYMWKILDNYCNKRWTLLRRRPTEVPLEYDDLEVNGVLPSSVDPAVGVVDREFIRRCLGALPARQQQVLLLRHVEDMPDEAIAALLGIAMTTVRRHAMDGATRLRQVVVEQSGTP
jgi:RNA polymerase sigma factor (sigma-70 family)